MYISIYTACSSTNECIIKKSGLNGWWETPEVELTVADDELKAALTTGGPIGTTGGIYEAALPLSTLFGLVHTT